MDPREEHRKPWSKGNRAGRKSTVHAYSIWFRGKVAKMCSHYIGVKTGISFKRLKRFGLGQPRGWLDSAATAQLSGLPSIHLSERLALHLPTIVSGGLRRQMLVPSMTQSSSSISWSVSRLSWTVRLWFLMSELVGASPRPWVATCSWSKKMLAGLRVEVRKSGTHDSGRSTCRERGRPISALALAMAAIVG